MKNKKIYNKFIFKDFYICMVYSLLFVPIIHYFICKTHILEHEGLIERYIQEQLHLSHLLKAAVLTIVKLSIYIIVLLILILIIYFMCAKFLFKKYIEHRSYFADEYRPYLNNLVKRKYVIEWNNNILNYYECIVDKYWPNMHDELASRLEFFLLLKRKTFLYSFPEVLLLWCYLFYSKLLDKDLSLYYYILISVSIFLVVYRLFFYLKKLKETKDLYDLNLRSGRLVTIDRKLYEYLRKPYDGVTDLLDPLKLLWSIIK